MTQSINLNWNNRSVVASALIFCIVRKNWAYAFTASGCYGRQVGWMAGWQMKCIGGF